MLGSNPSARGVSARGEWDGRWPVPPFLPFWRNYAVNPGGTGAEPSLLMRFNLIIWAGPCQ